MPAKAKAPAQGVRKAAGTGASRHRSNRAWIERHINDPYVQAATRQGYRSRAAFKLIEIDRRDQLLRPGAVVVDLGAAPGSWSQVAAERVGAGGRVIALDILPMEPLPGVVFLQGDFREDGVLDGLLEALGGRSVDLVMSDLSPNLSGIRAADAVRGQHLLEIALDFALRVLKPDGRFLAKAFQGSGYSQFVQELKRHFRQVHARKPPASRQESAETYVLAHGRKTAAASAPADLPPDAGGVGAGMD